MVLGLQLSKWAYSTCRGFRNIYGSLREPNQTKHTQACTVDGHNMDISSGNISIGIRSPLAN